MKRILFFILIISAFSSCKMLDQSIMLRTPKDYTFAEIPDTLTGEYNLEINDIIQFRLFSNDGFKLVDVVSQDANSNRLMMNNMPSYKIDFDGTAKLPVLGRVKLSGMTLRKAELYLEEQYAAFYNNPYILLSVNNRRVIVFPGNSGNATVLALQNDNTTLLEALASVGGLKNDAKAHRIKVIRGPRENPEVYLVDLSTIEGIKDGSMVLQSNDIIYVEPRVRTVVEITKEITPLIGLISATTSLITSIYSLVLLSQIIQ